VLLITDYSSAISAQVYQGTDVVRGVIQGQWQRGSRLILHSVAREAPLAAGDTVLTAGLSAELALNLPRAAVPPNVPIGVIEMVQDTGRDRIAGVRPFVDPDRVRYAWGHSRQRRIEEIIVHEVALFAALFVGALVQTALLPRPL